jgi:hypothetical protein
MRFKLTTSHIQKYNRIGDVMANTADSVVDCGFKHRSDQTNVM